MIIIKTNIKTKKKEKKISIFKCFTAVTLPIEYFEQYVYFKSSYNTSFDAHKLTLENYSKVKTTMEKLFLVRLHWPCFLKLAENIF